MVDKLLNEKLLQELRAKDDMPVWRRGDDNRSYSLRITKAGLRAIEVEDATEASKNNARRPIALKLNQPRTRVCRSQVPRAIEPRKANELVKKTAGKPPTQDQDIARSEQARLQTGQGYNTASAA